MALQGWKSLCQIHLLKGHRPERIKCLVYGRLIAIVMMNILYGFASWYSETHLKRETSLHKLIEWLKRRERLSRAALLSRFQPLLSHLIQDLPSMICKRKLERKTTQELIESLTPYVELFPMKISNVRLSLMRMGFIPARHGHSRTASYGVALKLINDDPFLLDTQK